MSVTHGKVEAQTDLADMIKQVAAAQADLVAEAVSLGTTIANAMDALPGFVPCDHAFCELIVALSLSTGRVSLEDLADARQAAYERRSHIADHRGVETPEPHPVLAELAQLDSASPQRAKLALLAVLQAEAPYLHRAMELGVMETQLNVHLAQACKLIHRSDADLKAMLDLEKQLGADFQEALYLGLDA